MNNNASGNTRINTPPGRRFRRSGVESAADLVSTAPAERFSENGSRA
jgi:hypothetical protein